MKQSAHMTERASYFETYDPLTETVNRKTMRKRAEQKLLESQEDKTAWSLTLVTPKNLADINDTSGHDLGDRVLQELAAMLEGLCDDECIVSRISGATFAIFTPQKLYNRQHKIVAARLKRGFKLNIDSRAVLVKLNSGTAHFPQHGDTFETLLRNAELTLCHAQNVGPNIYKTFTPELAATQRAHTALKKSFKNAILKQQIIPYYLSLIHISEPTRPY